jgi:hypothetical protein
MPSTGQLLVLIRFEDGNFECEFYTLIRPNQEQLRKMQLLDPLAGIEPATLRFRCSNYFTFAIFINKTLLQLVTSSVDAQNPEILVIIHSRALNQSVIVERVTCRSNILRYWTGTYWTVANRGFSWFFNPFQMFCQLQTYDKRYGRVMKIIWGIIQFFLPVLFRIIKARENLSSRNSFVCNSLDVSNIIFFVKIRSNFV